MSKRVLVAGIVAVLALAGGFFYLYRHAAGANASAAGAAVSAAPWQAPAAKTISTGNVRLIERALDSDNRQTQATALATEIRTVYLQSGQSMLPPGTTVTIEAKTFKASDGAAVVQASSSIGKTFAIRLEWEHGSWLILYAVEES